MAIDQKIVDGWIARWIKHLMDRGFTEDQAHTIIKQTNYDMKAAIEKAEELERAKEE